MKSFKVIGEVFLLVGIISLIGLGISIVRTNDFLSKAVITQGKIIDVVVKVDSDSHGNTTRSRYPVIRFRDNSGNTIEFQSSVSTNAGIMFGQNVTVRYLTENPAKAKLANSVMDIWGVSIVLACFGLVFSGVGMGCLWLGIRDKIKERQALAYTKEIIANLQGVVKNTSLSMNGRSPYQIVAQWVNPETNQLHIFKSKNIWFDPSDYVKKEILVKADPNNLKKYWMDVSFIPEEAGANPLVKKKSKQN